MDLAAPVAADLPGEAGAGRGRAHFTLIQALRGVAALWVVLFHIYKSDSIAALAGALPAPVTHALFGYGSAGVAIFFVLSGFVIAHSLHGRRMSGRDYGRFLLRRSIRLDPSYWCSILAALAVGWLLAAAHHARWTPPSAGVVAAHLLYLQELLRLPEIQIVYWTLTYEVQFYAVLAGACVVAGRLPPRWKELPFGIMTLAAFGAAAWTGGDMVPGLFINLWHAFFAGVLAYQAGFRRRSPLLLGALAAVMLVAGRWEEPVFVTPAAVTALGLFAAGRFGLLQRGLPGRPWQMLGAISYSLYLLHLPVLRIVSSACTHLLGRSPVRDLLSLAVQLAAVLVAGAAGWWLVERPSHRLAQRLGQVGPDAR